VESIGEKLRQARESKKITIKEVVQDTNINPVYLTALEEEDFDKFPSETYLTGFLRNYAEYLKLDSDEIIQAYKGYKIGESVTPLEELTKSSKTSYAFMASSFFNKFKMYILAGGIALFVFVLVWGINSVTRGTVNIKDSSSVDQKKDKFTAKNSDNISKIKQLNLQDNKGFIFISTNEAFQFMVDDKEVVVIIKDVQRNAKDVKLSTVTIETRPDNKKYTISMEKATTLEMNGLTRKIHLSLKGIAEKKANVQVKVDKKTGDDKKQLVADNKIPPATSTTVEVKDKRNLRITFVVTFTQKSFFEIYIDSVKKRHGFIPAGKTISWEAKQFIQVKVGNAGGVVAKINGKIFPFGKAGQVANKVIKWKKDIANPNRYHIVVENGK